MWVTTYQSMTADASESLTKPQRLWKAFHEKPLHALPHVPLNIYTSCATTMNHHEAFSTTAAPTSPHPNFSISNQLNSVCSTSATADIAAITIILLCACRNLAIGKFTAYAYNCGIIHTANVPAVSAIESACPISLNNDVQKCRVELGTAPWCLVSPKTFACRSPACRAAPRHRPAHIESLVHFPFPTELIQIKIKSNQIR